MAHEDQALILKAQKDPQAFQLVYRQYHEKIYNYFWYRTGHNSELSEDLMQEVFTRAFKALPRYVDSGVSYFSYLLSIAHNMLVNQYRKKTSFAT